MKEDVFGQFASLLSGKTTLKELAYKETKERMRKLFVEQFVFIGVCALLSLKDEHALLFLVGQVREQFMRTANDEIEAMDALDLVDKEDVEKIIDEIALELAERFEEYRVATNESGAADQATPSEKGD